MTLRSAQAPGAWLLASIAVSALSFGAGCSSTDRQRIEILPQQGHGRQPTQIWTYRRRNTVFLESVTDRDDRRLWSRQEEAGSAWVLRRHWTNAVHRWELGRERPELHLIRSAAGVELVRVGAWGRPLLTAADGLPLDVSEVRALLPPASSRARWRGVAVRGVRGAWQLFGTRDGRSWGRLELPDGPSEVLDLHVFEGPILAVLGPTPAATADTPAAGWRFFGVDYDGRWSRRVLPDHPHHVAQVLPLDGGRVFGVSRGPGFSRFGWEVMTVGLDRKLLRSTDQILAEITEGTEETSVSLAELSSPGSGVLAVRRARPDPDASAHPERADDPEQPQEEKGSDAVRHTPAVDRFYLMRVDDDWVRLPKVAPRLPPRIQAVQVHGGGDVLAVQELDYADGDAEIAEWSYVMRAADGSWGSLASGLPGAPAKIWDVQTILDGDGLGLRDARDSNQNERHYDWVWFLREPSSRAWRPASEALSGLSERIFALESHGRDVLSAAPPPASSGRAARRTWYIRAESGAWKPLEDLLQLGQRRDAKDRTGEVAGVEAHHDGVVVTLRKGEDLSKLFFYRAPDGGWRRVEARLHTARVSAGAGRVATYPAIDPLDRTYGAGLAMLRERGDADGNGVAGETQVLERGTDGVWRGVERVEAARTLGATLEYEPAAGLLVMTTRRGARTFYHRVAPGDWRDIRTLAGAPGSVRAAFAFARGQGVAVQAAPSLEGGVPSGDWHYFLGARGGQLVPVSTAIGGGLAKSPEGFHDFGDGFGLAVQEADAGNSLRIGAWRYLVDDPKAGWRDITSMVGEDAVAEASAVVLRAGGTILGVQDPNERWRWMIRTAWGRWVPYADALEGAPEAAVDVLSVWGGRGLAVRGQSRADGWRVYGQIADGAWRVLTTPLGPDVDQVVGDDRGRLLAARTAVPTKLGGAMVRWSVWARTDSGGGKPDWGDVATQEELRIPNPIGELRIDASGAIGLRASNAHDGAPAGTWTWIRPRPDGTVTRLGRTGTADWFGYDFVTAGAADRLRFEGALHFVDGRPTESVPAPRAWLHQYPDGTSDGSAFWVEPTLLPGGVDVYAPGDRGPLVVYRRGGRTFAVASTGGTVRYERRRLVGQDGVVELLVFAEEDGTLRLHRMDSPDRWIRAFEAADGPKRVYFDEYGHFYSDRDELTEQMSFRIGEDVYAFDQFAALLFRPDRLEAALGLDEGSLFPRTARDVMRIAVARDAAPDALDVAALTPPTLTLGAYLRKVSKCRVQIPVSAAGAGVVEGSIRARLIGAGQATGAAPVWEGSEWLQTDTVELDIPLLPGKNEIEISVADARHLRTTRRAVVRCMEGEKPDLWLVVVGTAEYDAGFTPLPMTQVDVRAVLRLFGEQRGLRFNEVHARSFCQGRCTDVPLRSRLAEAIPAHLANVRHGDHVVVYVSGHGIEKDGEYYFAPQDAVRDDLATFVSWSQLRQWLLRKAVVAKRLVLLDTCHSGRIFGRSNQNRVAQQTAERDGIYMLAAAAGNAQAFEARELGNGLFTSVLLQALREGRADRLAPAGQLTFEELAYYMAREVRSQSGERGEALRQEPFLPVLNRDLDYVVAEVPKGVPIHLSVRDHPGVDAQQKDVMAWRQRLRAALPTARVEGRRDARYLLTVVQLPERTFLLDVRDVRGREVFRRDDLALDAIDDALAELAPLLK